MVAHHGSSQQASHTFSSFISTVAFPGVAHTSFGSSTTHGVPSHSRCTQQQVKHHHFHVIQAAFIQVLFPNGPFHTGRLSQCVAMQHGSGSQHIHQHASCPIMLSLTGYSIHPGQQQASHTGSSRHYQGITKSANQAWQPEWTVTTREDDA